MGLVKPIKPLNKLTNNHLAIYMSEINEQAIKVMTDAFQRMEAVIEPPKILPTHDSFVYKYKNNGIYEALIQKMARYISGLNAVNCLIKFGYAQEIGVIKRTLDEISEDIHFLCTANDSGTLDEIHIKFLQAFNLSSVTSRPKGTFAIAKPNLVPRKKIRAHTFRKLGKGFNTQEMYEANDAVSTAYSGYVHAASENIMDMYGGEKPHYHLQGLLNTPRIKESIEAFDDYVLRGIMTTIFTAKKFGNAKLVEELYEFLKKYEHKT